MKVKCRDCNNEATGRYGKLLKYGWKIIFIDEHTKIVKCVFCKLDEKKLKEDVKEAVNKMILLSRLKEREEDYRNL